MGIKSFLLGLLAVTMAWGQTSYTFSDGGKRIAYQLSTDEVYSAGAQDVQLSRTSSAWGGGTVHVLQSRSSMKALRGNYSAGRKSLSPVFYYEGNLPSAEALAAMSPAERAKRMDGARRLMTAKLLIHMDDSRYAELSATNPVAKEKSLLKGWMLVNYADAFAALDAADWLNTKNNWEFTPVFARESFVRQALQRAVNDPLFPKQWHLAETDLNLNMKTAWDQVTGKGINIAVIDDGLEIKHEDFTNAYPLDSGYHRNFKEDGAPNDPSPLDAKDNHGTFCAGLAAAAGFNGIGVAGGEPEAMVMGLRYVGGATADDAASVALGWQPDGIITHVSSNSWGPADDGKDDGRISALQLAGMEKAVITNRDGLGTILSISAGNGRDSGDNASYDGFSSSRFAIAVAAVGRDGTQSSYSENGMSVAITAFGGEFQPPAVLWSTNVSGDEAFQIKATNFPTTEAPVNYTDAGNGTSAAAPQVSGAAALLLEKNPKLGYRDVKEILMKSAIQEGLTGADPFVKNGAGFSFSHSFGAGLLNVSGALELAAEWTNLGALISAAVASEEGGDIPDEGDGVTKTLDFSNISGRVEHAVLTVSVTHAKRGDLEFSIVSPAGTRSVAEARPNDENADFTDYVFTSVRHWGESSVGNWKVIVKDTKGNGVTGKLGKVNLELWGTAAQ